MKKHVYNSKLIYKRKFENKKIIKLSLNTKIKFEIQGMNELEN